MKKTILFIAVLWVMTVTVFGQSPITHTETEQGQIDGVIEEGLGAFLGVPYAQPPVGDLRWKAPKEPLPYSGVYKADHLADGPVQNESNQYLADKPRSEDCLYLNILTPAVNKNEKLPVMVWIHGGGFQTGRSYELLGHNLAHKGVIFVSVGYRLNYMGFLALPELTAESQKETGVETSGNYGLLDQIQALKWVKKNIAQFGGDPDKITIQGESAGGISVSMLCASPLARGLFRGAICESGGNFSPVGEVGMVGNGIGTLERAQKIGKEVLKELGLEKKSLKELRKIPAETFLKAASGHCWPNVDQYVLAGDQYKLYEQGAYNDVNLLVGTNSREGDMFARPGTLAEYNKEMNARFGSWAPKFKEVYPAETDADVIDARSNIFRDSAFGWSTYAWTNLQGKTGKSDIYVYYLDQPRPSLSDPTKMTKGTNHADDMQYVFGSPWYDFPGSDWGILKMFLTYFTNFVKTGNPNQDGITEPESCEGLPMPYWPKYVPGEAKVLKFHDGAFITSQPNLKEVELWEEYYKSIRK